VLGITNSEDLVKLRALAELCSQDFFNDPSLLVVALRRIMEILETEKNGGESRARRKTGMRGSWRSWTLVRLWRKRVIMLGIGMMRFDT